MRISDYKCINKECLNVFEYVKEKDLDSFPDRVECPKCKSEAHRVWNLVFDVAKGKLGNAKNGYNNSAVDHCSEYGKFKGTKVKTIK